MYIFSVTKITIVGETVKGFYFSFNCCFQITWSHQLWYRSTKKLKCMNMMAIKLIHIIISCVITALMLPIDIMESKSDRMNHSFVVHTLLLRLRWLWYPENPKDYQSSINNYNLRPFTCSKNGDFGIKGCLKVEVKVRASTTTILLS